MTQYDYLCSEDGSVHAINVQVDNASMSVGILCAIAFQESTIRIGDDHNAFTVELPKSILSSGDRVKAFNIELSILSHEQIQLPSADGRD